MALTAKSYYTKKEWAVTSKAVYEALRSPPSPAPTSCFFLSKNRGENLSLQNPCEKLGAATWAVVLAGKVFGGRPIFPHWRRFNVTQQWWWVTLTTLDWGHQGKALFSSQIVFKGPYTAIEILEQRLTSITDNVTIPHCKQGTHWDCQQPRGT